MLIAKVPGGYHVETETSFMANGPAKSWRDALGDMLRRLATRIDRRDSVAIRVTTSPELPRDDVLRAVESGLSVAHLHVKALVREAACEAVLKRAQPALYQE
ncbi:hypothetical protein [Denitromonas halophila]|uniref:Uncharacterized protein n=1 Tax=Denitromonas halophila TaxID=1629404 RepID=A0A557QX92_9RHOO|nr:hypothetical protein [Denitromonas halophila]TVO57540.1 hypothetical protein FHP91_07640 [Denitromonas halophila]